MRLWGKVILLIVFCWGGIDAAPKIKRRVLILDFVNQQNNPTYSYLSNTVAEGMVGPLEKTNSFHILSRDLAERVIREKKAARKDLYRDSVAVELGKQAEADVVVIGNYVTIKNTMLIQAKAVDVHAGRVKVSRQVKSTIGTKLFNAIEKLAKQMAREMKKKLPPMKQRIVYQKAKRQGIQFQLTAIGHASMPIGTLDEALDLSAGGHLSFEMRFYGFRYGYLSAAASSGYYFHNTSDSNVEIKLGIIPVLGGLNLGIPLFANEKLALHFIALGGTAFSQLKVGKETRSFNSTDFMIRGQFEVRYLLTADIYAATNASYDQIFYTGQQLQELHFGLGLGFIF